MGGGCSILETGEVIRKPVVESALDPDQAAAEELIKRKVAQEEAELQVGGENEQRAKSEQAAGASDATTQANSSSEGRESNEEPKDATPLLSDSPPPKIVAIPVLNMLRLMQKALSTKVSIHQIYARSEWCIKETTDGTNREYFVYQGPHKALQAEDSVKLFLQQQEGQRQQQQDKVATVKDNITSLLLPKQYMMGEKAWKRKPTFGPEWEGERGLDRDWNRILGHIVLRRSIKAGRYGRSLVSSMISYLEARRALYGASIFKLLAAQEWDNVETLVRSDPAAAQRWAHAKDGEEAQGLSALQFAILKLAPASVIRLIVNACPRLVDEKTRNGTPCFPLWQAARQFTLGQRRSTDAPKPAALDIVQEVFISNPFQSNERGPDKAVPLQDVAPKFLFNKRVLQCLASIGCPRLARREFGGVIPLEAAIETAGVSLEDVTKLVWVCDS